MFIALIALLDPHASFWRLLILLALQALNSFLVQGETLFYARKNELLESTDLSIAVSKESVVHIVKSNNAIVVRCVASRGGQISVTNKHNGATHILNVGQEIFINGAEMPNDGIARRREAAFCEGSTATVLSDFSPSSLFKNSSIISWLLKSTNKTDRAMLNSILKSAACLSIVTSHYGPYNEIHAETGRFKSRLVN